MKVIKLQNDSGETIEVKRGANGAVLLRHSDVDATDFGIFKDSPNVAEICAKHGIDKNSPDGAGVVRLAEMFLGPHMEFRRTKCILNADEVAMIREAINQLE